MSDKKSESQIKVRRALEVVPRLAAIEIAQGSVDNTRPDT